MRTASTTVLVSLLIAVSAVSAEDDTTFESLNRLVQQQIALGQQQAAVIQQQSADLQALRDEVNALKALNARKAAFSVTFRGDEHSINIGNNSPIRFDQIITNVGNGYSTGSGIFTAPYSGIYALFVSFRSVNEHDWLGIGIYKGDTMLVEAVADGHLDEFDKGSAFVTVHLNQGDRVYVKHRRGDTYIESGIFTTFSGLLVSAD